MSNESYASRPRRVAKFSHSVTLLLALCLFGPLEVGAATLQQIGGPTTSARQTPAPRPASEGERGFLFERPRGSVSIRSGLLFHRAGSDVFDFAEERFTLDRSDFRAISIGIEGTVWFGDHVEGTAAIEGSQVTLHSESRGYLEENGNPIRQTTRLAFGPSISVGARFFILERGESLGSLVWIPQRWNVFVGGGGGVAAYRYEQWGDFVNETTEIIFTSDIKSEGAVFTPYVTGGATYNLTPRVALLVEGRYQWGKAELQDQFTGFEPIDLAGLRTMLSVGYNF